MQKYLYLLTAVWLVLIIIPQGVAQELKKDDRLKQAPKKMTQAEKAKLYRQFQLKQAESQAGSKKILTPEQKAAIYQEKYGKKPVNKLTPAQKQELKEKTVQRNLQRKQELGQDQILTPQEMQTLTLEEKEEMAAIPGLAILLKAKIRPTLW